MLPHARNAPAVRPSCRCVAAGHGHNQPATLAPVPRPNMVNHSIRFTPKVWAKVRARAEAREQSPSDWVRRLVEREVEDDPEPDE